MKNDTASCSIHESVVVLEVDELFPYDINASACTMSSLVQCNVTSDSDV